MLLNHFGTFMKTSRKPTMSQRFSQHKLQCCHQIHWLTEWWYISNSWSFSLSNSTFFTEKTDATD
jgi:hypothetical protein